jgi:hypothetical protein
VRYRVIGRLCDCLDKVKYVSAYRRFCIYIL